MKPHEHKELIKLWAEGYPIQVRLKSDEKWIDLENPSWSSDLFQYRVKPKFEIGSKVSYSGKVFTVADLVWNKPRSMYEVWFSEGYWGYELDCKTYVEPKLVPFTFDDAEMLIGKAIKCNDGLLLVCLIEAIEKDGVTIGDIEYTFDCLLKEWVFLDGSPCGKEVK